MMLNMNRDGNRLYWWLLVVLLFFTIAGCLPSEQIPIRVPEEGIDEPTDPAVTEPEISERPLSGRVIAVDPGHGGPDPGTLGVGVTTEAENVLAISLYLQQMLEDSGAKVVMTRTEDVCPSVGTSFHGVRNGRLSARTHLANRARADIFVSIHNDWNNNHSVSGTTTYYYHGWDMGLATAVQAAVVRQLGSRNVGIRFGNFFVLRNAHMPSILVEAGFLSNRVEAGLMAQSWYRKQVAEGIYWGIRKYFESQ